MKKKENGDEEKNNFPSHAEVVKYEMLEKLLDASFIEMKEFAKKKPDEFLNKFKVKSLIHRLRYRWSLFVSPKVKPTRTRRLVWRVNHD